MTRLALVAVAFVLAACRTKEQPADTARTDTAPAMAPAPADTADTTKMDTTKMDTTKMGTKKRP